MSMKEKLIIGWREWVELPEFRGVIIKVKVDTGARTSSLHASEIKELTHRGKKKVRFLLYPSANSREGAIKIEAPLVEYRSIRSSSGHREVRPVIVTMIRLMGREWPIEVTLTDRNMMGFRMLLGRKALRNQFLVSVNRSFFGKKK